MTEAETAKLLADLTALAPKLNEESDSLNPIFDAWQRKLAALNIGLEEWVTISSEERSVRVDDEDALRRRRPEIPAFRELLNTKEVTGSIDTQFGWCGGFLMIRQITYRGDLKDKLGDQRWEEITRDNPRLVQQVSRQVRIEALEQLPRLLERLKTAAESAVEKIQRAKRLVKDDGVQPVKRTLPTVPEIEFDDEK